ncbi:MAG: hypothetical protein RLN76_07740 [Phycisphaeraceae bacterium]
MVVRPVLMAALLMGSVAWLPGCSASRDNAVLRRERAEHQDTIARMTEELRRSEAEIAALRQRLELKGNVEGADAPVFSQVTLGRLSGAVDTDEDGVKDTLRAYVRTLDDRGRMRPISGQAVVDVVRIVSGGEPVVLARKVYGPKAFDAAYRSGITGTHYTFELPIDGAAVDEATVRVTITDTESGLVASVQQTFSLK